MIETIHRPISFCDVLWSVCKSKPGVSRECTKDNDRGRMVTPFILNLKLVRRLGFIQTEVYSADVKEIICV